jgi:hypothetical protein
VDASPQLSIFNGVFRLNFLQVIPGTEFSGPNGSNRSFYEFLRCRGLLSGNGWSYKTFGSHDCLVIQSLANWDEVKAPLPLGPGVSRVTEFIGFLLSQPLPLLEEPPIAIGVTFLKIHEPVPKSINMI